MKKLKLYLLLAPFLVLLACNRDKKSTSTDNTQGGNDIIQSSPKADKYSKADTIKAVGQEVVLALENKDYSELVKYFSEKGVVFSPYATLAPRKQVKMTADEFLEAIKSNKVLKWGNYDGTGEEIRLSTADFLKKFITKAKFSEAEAISFDATMKQGNSINNILDVYPDAHYVEYHFSSIDPKFEGMDWTSLRLVFERIGDEYFLIAIVQDQWTV